jgi:5'-3' exonuclease
VIRTLIVDADNLFKIGFHGVREFYHEGQHIGGIFHFLNVLRKVLVEQEFDKVFVVWDGPNNSVQRKSIYSEYKNNRTSSLTESKRESFYFQKNRVKQYLEEMFVRQVCLEGCESDDVIAYYCQISPDEHKTIFSSDKDLTQLISDKVEIYSPIHRETYRYGEKIKIGQLQIPTENVVTLKVFLGDKSDNIPGIDRLGEKTFVKFFPEILDTPISVDYIVSRTKELLSEDDSLTVLNNLINGKTKTQVLGENFVKTNISLVDLSSPLLSEENKEEIQSYYSEDIDPEGRGYKNILRYMEEDGIFKYLPKTNDGWVEFVQPFLKLTRKEKRRTQNLNKL